MMFALDSDIFLFRRGRCHVGSERMRGIGHRTGGDGLSRRQMVGGAIAAARQAASPRVVTLPARAGIGRRRHRVVSAMARRQYRRRDRRDLKPRRARHRPQPRWRRFGRPAGAPVFAASGNRAGDDRWRRPAPLFRPPWRSHTQSQPDWHKALICVATAATSSLLRLCILAEDATPGCLAAPRSRRCRQLCRAGSSCGPTGRTWGAAATIGAGWCEMACRKGSAIRPLHRLPATCCGMVSMPRSRWNCCWREPPALPSAPRRYRRSRAGRSQYRSAARA